MADQQATTAPSTAELLSRLSEQSTRLVRDELALAKLELTEKAKFAGIGAGLFSVAGLLAYLGLATLVATAVLALAEAMPAWLAALIVALLVFATAGIAAYVGKRKVTQAAPPVPEEAMENIRLDIAEVKGARRA